MTPKEKRAQELRKKLEAKAKNNPKAQQLLAAEKQRQAKKKLNCTPTAAPVNVSTAHVIYQNAVINYVQQVDICIIKQVARERLAYDLFLTIAKDSSITPNQKAVIKNIASELTEMIPKVGEFLEVASDTNASFVEARVKGSEVKVRYAAIQKSISQIDISSEKGRASVGVTINQYLRTLLNEALLVKAAKSAAEKKQEYDYYIKAAALVNKKTVALRAKVVDIQKIIPSSKSKYKAAMSGILKKASVAKMFKYYLIQWLNKSGHSFVLYPSYSEYTSRNLVIVQDKDISTIRRSVVVESLTLTEKLLKMLNIYDYEDTAVTLALVDLKLLRSKNAPVTENAIRAFGLKMPVKYVLDTKYRIMLPDQGA